jgi:hypothetical protein
MEIILKEPVLPSDLPIYLGNRSRFPTVTDVVFVSENRIVVAHRNACKVYYIELEETKKYRILDEIVLYVNGRPHRTEMMDIRNSSIYLISYTEYLTIIDIIGDKLHIRQSIPLNKTHSPYHGIQVSGNNVYITPSNKRNGDDSIVVWNTITNRIQERIQSPDIGSTIRIKDITFIREDRIVLLGNYKVETDMMTPGHIFHGFIGLYTLDFRKICHVEFDTTQFDSVTSKDGIYYATGADLEGGYIYKGGLINDELSPIQKYSVHDFPHGICIYGTKLAYTSYTTSAVYITELDEY